MRALHVLEEALKLVGLLGVQGEKEMSRDTRGDHQQQHVIRVRNQEHPATTERCCNVVGAVAKGLSKKNHEYRRPSLEGKVLLFLSLLSLLLDPWYLYILHIPGASVCLYTEKQLMIILVVLGSLFDISYFAVRYYNSVFGAFLTRSAVSHVVDILSILPLTQVSILLVFPLWSNHDPLSKLQLLAYILFIRLLLLLFRTCSSYKETARLSGSFITAPSAGAVFAATVFIVLCNVVGAFWYNFSTGRVIQCWHSSPDYRIQNHPLINCNAISGPYGGSMISNLVGNCSDTQNFDYGIYQDAVESRILSQPGFFEKFSYCFWWAFQNMSSLGQNLKPSTFIGEKLFVLVGVVCFSLLIATMQAYLQPLISKMSEKDRGNDLRKWKPYYSLPRDVREQVMRQRTANLSKEMAGVNLESLLNNVTGDLRRTIKSHLCSHALSGVPVFKEMNKEVANALHDRLRPVLFAERSFIIQDGFPVFEMIFVVQGKLLSYSNLDGDVITSASAKVLMEGDFCGEELLAHVMTHESCSSLPIAVRTIQSVTKVEAFALSAWDLNYVISRYRGCLFPAELESWAVRTIQKAWRRHLGVETERSFSDQQRTF